MRITSNYRWAHATVAVAAAAWIAGTISDSTLAQVRPRAFTVIDIGSIRGAGALNNETGNALTAAIDINRFVGGVQRGIPTIRTIDDPCRSVMELDNDEGTALSINDSRIVVGRSGLDAMEWFPSPCPNTVQAGALPRLPPAANFRSAVAHGNNNTRDAVGSTTVFVPTVSATHDVPTVWRAGLPGSFSVQQLQTAFRPAPFNNVRQPGGAHDINESGTIVGFTRVGDQAFNRACIFRDGQDPEILQRTPAAADLLFRFHEALAVSDSGFIAGHATRRLPGGARQSRGFLLRPDGTSEILLIPNNGQHTGGRAFGVNDAGQAVGSISKSDGGLVAALWSAVSGKWAPLTSTNVEGLAEGVTLTEAVDINNEGAILAKGLLNGQLRAFILRRTGAPIYYVPESQSF